MNGSEAHTLTSQATNVESMGGATPSATPTPQATTTPNTDPIDSVRELEEGGETKGVSEDIQWLTLLIVGLTVVSLIMNIVNNKKQIEKLEGEDSDVQKKLKEHDINLKRALGKKYEPLG